MGLEGKKKRKGRKRKRINYLNVLRKLAQSLQVQPPLHKLLVFNVPVMITQIAPIFC